MPPSRENSILVQGTEYHFVPLPSHPELNYCEVGRKAKVYKVTSSENRYFALKVFFPTFRDSQIITVSKILNLYKDLPGLDVVERFVITAENSPDIVKEYPEYEFAVLMPWINKEAWTTSLLEKRNHSFEILLGATNALCQILYGLEVRQLAHSDLSGRNLLIDFKDRSISLVSLENMFGQRFPRPRFVPSGTPGYAHPIPTKNGQWCLEGDRFSTAVLIVEILLSSDSDVREASFGDSFFSQDEIGKKCERFSLVSSKLQVIHPQLSNLFSKAWFSRTLKSCPSIETWMNVIKSESK